MTTVRIEIVNDPGVIELTVEHPDDRTAQLIALELATTLLGEAEERTDEPI